MNESTSATAHRDEKQLVSFHLGNEEFGADIMTVREIVRVPDITLTPSAPHYIEGICNLRGNVLPIMDGRARFSMPREERTENNRVLVIDLNGETTGIIVDRVSEVLTIQTADIEVPPAVIGGIDSDYLEGVVKLDHGQRLILELDLGKVLNIETLGVEIGRPSLEQNQGAAEAAKENLDEEQLVSFSVGEEEYGIDIMQVKEIIRVPDIVHVPKAPFGVEGVVSIRNKLLPILNLRNVFGMPDAAMTDATRILVVDMGGVSVGIKVDRVSEVMRVPSRVIDETPAMMVGDGSEQIKGVAKLDNGERLILILDPERILSHQELRGVTGMKGIQADESSTASKQLIDEEQLVTFRLGAEEFAMKITAVQEINRMTEITKVPRAPHYLEGIVNLRGNVIPVIDLRKRFAMDETDHTDATRIIIIDLAGTRTGMIVDSVSEVLRLERSAIEPPPSLAGGEVDAEYIEGVGKLNNGQRMVMILDLSQIVAMRAPAQERLVSRAEAETPVEATPKAALKKAGPKPRK